MNIVGTVGSGTGPADLLLVAGPSGSGKSTFAKLLASRNPIRSELKAALPANARAWPRLSAHALHKARYLQPSPGLILEYEITQSLREGYGYDADPALALLRSAQRATVVTIWTDTERIVQQRRNRHTEHARTKSHLQTTWRHRVRNPIKKLRRTISRTDVPHKAALFDRAGWLDHCYVEWTSFVRTECAAKGWSFIDVVPVGNTEAPHDFAIRDGARPSA